MRALIFDGQSLSVKEDVPTPAPQPGWARIRIIKAGIGRTDLELTRGYMGFKGILGHGFVGEVDVCEDEAWLGKRVVGEINAACGTCDWCTEELGRHCPHRSVLGILNLDGCMAEYCLLPKTNLRAVPEPLSDDQAVFTEPLSAAYEILDQLEPTGFERCVVLGDGKLGILCAWVLNTVCSDVTLVGHHPGKLETASQWGSLSTATGSGSVEPGADIVVDATGSGQGMTEAMALCRPRGTLVLKSTVASQGELNLAPVVINELNVVGSRCGLFEHGLAGLVTQRFPVERLVEARYPLAQAEQAFEHAGRKGVLKVMLEMS
jgi:alcohol dehydrogenase